MSLLEEECTREVIEIEVIKENILVFHEVVYFVTAIEVVGA